MPSKMDLAARSFETVLRHVEHEDDKANRIVISMAFITAAAAAVFTEILGDPDPVATVAGKDVNMTILMFAVFVGFVAAGTLFMLAALGPKFNLLEGWGDKQDRWSDEKSSLLFSQVIAKHPYEVWRSHWADATDQSLEEEMERHLINETYLLSRKAEYKVDMMSFGRSLYRWALMALAWFLAVSFSGELDLGLSIGGVVASLILIQTGWESGIEPAGTKGTVLSEQRCTPKGIYSLATLSIGCIGLAVATIFTCVVLLQ